MSVRNDAPLNESSNSHSLSRLNGLKASDVYNSPKRKQVLRSAINYPMEPEVPRGFSNKKPLALCQDTFEVDASFSFSKKSSEMEMEETSPVFMQKSDIRSFKENFFSGNSVPDFSSKLIREARRSQGSHDRTED